MIARASDSPSVDSTNTETPGYLAIVSALVRTSGVYALASAASPLVTLVLAPYLTHSLTRTDYGALAVLNTLAVLGVGISQLGLNSAFFRAYNYDYHSPADRSAILSTTVILLALSSSIVCGCLLFLASPLAILLFGSPALAGAVRCAGVAMLVQNLTVPVFARLRADNRAGLFALLAVLNLLITLSATFLYIGILQWGIGGALLAVASGNAVVVLCNLPRQLRHVGLRFRRDIAHNLMSFGVPLVCSFISYWVLQLSDRQLLNWFSSLAETASYAVAYSLGGIISVLVVSPFMLSWPTAMFAIARRDDAAQGYRQVYRWLSAVLLLAGFASSLVGVALLHLLFPPAYYTAAPVIPIVTTSLVFYGIYNVFATGIGVRRMTWLSALFTTIAAVANVGFNLVLIPRYGATGAALSTLIAYFLLAAITYLANQRIYPVQFEIGRSLIALLVGAALYLSADILAPHDVPVWAGVIYLAAIVIYGVSLVSILDLPLAALVRAGYPLLGRWKLHRDAPRVSQLTDQASHGPHWLSRH